MSLWSRTLFPSWMKSPWKPNWIHRLGNVNTIYKHMMDFFKVPIELSPYVVQATGTTGSSSDKTAAFLPQPVEFYCDRQRHPDSCDDISRQATLVLSPSLHEKAVGASRF